jgi:hypothetical protein
LLPECGHCYLLHAALKRFSSCAARLFFSAKRPENCSCQKRKETNYNCEEHERFGQRQDGINQNEIWTLMWVGWRERSRAGYPSTIA